MSGRDVYSRPRMVTATASGPRAVLITGLFGTGKSSVVAELADILEKRGTAYAAIDLDWLGWFDSPSPDGPTEHEMMLTNLRSVVRNYLDVGVDVFVFARAVRTAAEVADFRVSVPMPVTVVRLTVPMAKIQRRLRTDVTSSRREDVRELAEWMIRSEGEGFEDWSVSNDRPIAIVAADIMQRLGWR
jgi:hypothetical protein